MHTAQFVIVEKLHPGHSIATLLKTAEATAILYLSLVQRCDNKERASAQIERLTH
jgi:hypothetical protein